MCRNLVFVLSVILVFSLCAKLQAADYYISPSGSDSNSGTSPEQAWQTIERVNSTTFAPGDSILFEGGQTFDGSIAFDANDSGTAGNPVAISSYGTGKATIYSAYADGIYARNCAGLEVKNLKFTGSGRSDPNGGYGLVFVNDLDDNIKLEYISIDNVEVSDYFEIGVYISGQNRSNSGFKDITITNCEIHDCGNIGINSGGWWPVDGRAHEDIYIADCVIYNISGIPGRQPHSGNGIVLAHVDGATVEFCEAYNNGWLCDASGGGPLGIWGWEADNFIIQFCESHHNKTSGGDGGGFDLDGGATNSIMQYNYSHDNEGCGYLICQFGGAGIFENNICRYNISENDCSGSRSPMGGIHFWTAQGVGMRDIEVYNNTICLGSDSIGMGIFVMSEDLYNVNIRNNIFLTTGGLPVVEVLGKATDKVTFQGNCYWSSGEDFIVKWGIRRIYNSLEEWRLETGQEMLRGQPVGLQVDPQLVYPNGGGTIGDPHLLDALIAYKLAGSSPLIDAGLDLEVLFNIDSGPRDYYGTAIPSGVSPDIGAYEFDHDAPADITAPSPDPMTWATEPHSTGESSISMTAASAFDDSGVEYYFTCTAGGGHDSGWQNSPTYEDSGLVPDTLYSYTVVARDKSINQNQTALSEEGSAKTSPADLEPPNPDPMTWAVAPYAVSNSSISMAATAATDVSGVEYYFACTLGDGYNSGWQDSRVYTDTGLQPETEYAYSVQARDKAINQNVTDWSVEMSATTKALDTVMFSDGFESGDFETGDWTVSGLAEISRGASYSGSYMAELQQTAWIEKAISTVGFTDIKVKFVCDTKGLDSSEGEYLFVEWYDGSDWHGLDMIKGGGWTYKEKLCGTGANNNELFKVRFRIVANHLMEEWARVDDVEIAGLK